MPLPPLELETAFSDGVGFDGSSVQGFARIEESDMVARPDPNTFKILPWRPEDRPVARMFCDILESDGSPHLGDCRQAFRRLIDDLLGREYIYHVGSEPEFYYFKNSTSPEPIDSAGFFDSRPLDLCNDLRRETIFALQDMGIAVEYSHHQTGPGQNEIPLRHENGLTMADNTVTYRVLVKEIAHRHDCFASFMPKPLQNHNGSGMHVHQSLFRGGKNVFFDGDDPNHLSELAKHFMAGLMYHAREITAITNQWVNSYKRLVPGYGAPVYVAWARRSRSALIRVPGYRTGNEEKAHIEYRSPDPALNPYLAFSVMLAAGMEGVRHKYPLADPVEEDMVSLSPRDLDKLGIVFLPSNLFEAIRELEASRLVKETLGEHIFNKFIENKKLEWDQYRRQVSQYEIDRYLPSL